LGIRKGTSEDRAVSFTLPPDANGILPDRNDRGDGGCGPHPAGLSLCRSQIQPASLDLRLGDIATGCARAFCPARAPPSPSGIDELKLHEIDLSDGAVLETNLRLHRCRSGEPGAAAVDRGGRHPKSSPGGSTCSRA